MTATIKLLPQDCDTTDRSSFMHCPHALAIKREFPEAHRVWVREHNVSLFFRDANGVSIEFVAPLTHEAQRHIETMDYYTAEEQKKTVRRPLRALRPISYTLHFSKV